MKRIARFFALGILTGCIALHAQNFTGSDNFSGVSGNWSGDTVANGGLFTLSSNVLNYTDGGVTSQTSSAQRYWNANSGSSTADWQVQIDLALNLTQVGSQISYWNLVFSNSGDATDYFQVEYLRSYMQLNPFVRGTTYTDSVMGTTQQIDVTAAVSVRVDYLAATKTLTLAYDPDGSATGYNFTNLYSSTVTAWTMGPTDVFALNLIAANQSMSLPTSPVALGEMYADNFLASGAAIPEPSTYAACFGVLALLAAGLKRRFGQQ